MSIRTSKNVRIYLCLPEELSMQLGKLAIDMRMTKSEIVRLWIKKMMKKEEEKNAGGK